MNRNLVFVAIGCAVFLAAVGSFKIMSEQSPYPGVGVPDSEHVHSKFVLQLDGARVIFAPNITGYADLSEYIFLGGTDGNTIHRFATGATLGMFFDSFGMKFDSDCFTVPQKHNDFIALTPFPKLDRLEYCNNEEETLKMFVNIPLVGDFFPNPEFENYVPQSGDRILIIYGTETMEEIRLLFDNVGRVTTLP